MKKHIVFFFIMLLMLTSTHSASAQVQDFIGWTDVWFKSNWKNGNNRHHTTYNDINIGGTCAARWNPTNGETCAPIPVGEYTCLCETRENPETLAIEKVDPTCKDTLNGLLNSCPPCIPHKIYENLCENRPWHTTPECYTTQKLNNVEWLKACPRGQIVQQPASDFFTVYAKYAGPGREYDSATTSFVSGTVDASNNWLICTKSRKVPSQDPAITQEMVDEFNADFGPANPANQKKFALIGCSSRFDKGQWNPAVGSSPLLPNREFGPIPDGCMTPVAPSPAEVTELVCRPTECNLTTLQGCDIVQGNYQFYLVPQGLHGPITEVESGPDACPNPAFELADERFCGNKPGGCTNPNTGACNHDEKSYWAGLTLNPTPIPEQRLFLSFLAVGVGQPQQWVDENGTMQTRESSVIVQDFKNASIPGVIVGGTRETVYFPDEVPAAKGVLVIKGGAPAATYDLGVMPVQVRSMECTKRWDGYMPVQNVSLGQTKWFDMLPFYEKDNQAILDRVYPGAKPAHPTGGEGDSCDMVEALAKDLPTYNILSEGQDGFGMAHAVSTAVNQLLADLKPNTIPILTLTASEPVRDCIFTNNAPPNPSTAEAKGLRDLFPAGSFFRTSQTKWGSNGNDLGVTNNQGRLAVQCLNEKFTEVYSQALKDAAKRLRDKGGYVVTVALSCKSTKFKETLIDMSTGKVNLLNFAPEGVLLDDSCKGAMADNGALDPNAVAAQMLKLELDKDDNLFFAPAFAAKPVQPLFGTIQDVYAELAWVIIRDHIGQEVCANQAEGACDAVR